MHRWWINIWLIPLICSRHDCFPPVICHLKITLELKCEGKDLVSVKSKIPLTIFGFKSNLSVLYLTYSIFSPYSSYSSYSFKPLNPNPPMPPESLKTPRRAIYGPPYIFWWWALYMVKYCPGKPHPLLNSYFAYLFFYHCKQYVSENQARKTTNIF